MRYHNGELKRLSAHRGAQLCALHQRRFCGPTEWMEHRRGLARGSGDRAIRGCAPPLNLRGLRCKARGR